MIYGSLSSLSALQLIENSRYEFHLTGSRYFGNYGESSDWDFFVQDCPEMKTYLCDNGFKLETESYKEDPMFTSVWKKENVHVQVVVCAKAKEWIQYCLRPYFAAYKPDKERQKSFWTLGLKLYRGGMTGVAVEKLKLF